MSDVEGWSKKELGELTTLVKGISYASEDYCGPDEGAIFITIKCVSKAGGFNKEGIKYFKGAISPYQVLQPGDLLIANTDLTRAGDIIGCPMLVPKINGKIITMSMDLSKLVEDGAKVDRNFLYYKLMTDSVRRFMKDHASGSTVLHLQTRAIPSLELEIPTSKLEQAKIAEILSTVDRAIEQTEALIAKQQRIKNGLMQDFLICGIDENGNLRSEETHEFKDSTLGRIPMDWEVKPLSAIIEIIDCKHYTPAYIEDGIPIIRPRNIKDSGFDLSDLDYVTEKDYVMLTEKHEPTDGDIIFSRNASFGIPVYIEGMGRFCIGQDVVVMRKKTVDTRFVFFSLKSDRVVRQIMNVSGGSTFGRIDLGAIRELKIPVPKDECEQHEIAVRLLKCDKTIEIAAHNLMKLLSLKTGLMQDMLTGKKRVTALLTDKEKVNL